jgi:uncharacterized membrane protein
MPPQVLLPCGRSSALHGRPGDHLRPPRRRLATLAAGINDRGELVGQTLDTAGRAIGFLRDPNGRVTIIRLPGQAGVQEVLALNDRGKVVGTWDDRIDTRAIEPNTRHAFVWDRGRVTRFDVPGSLSTGALGINNSGQITGAYDDAGGHGFLLQRGRYTTIDAPGRTVTDAWGINDRGEIVVPDLGTGLTPPLGPITSDARGIPVDWSGSARRVLPALGGPWRCSIPRRCPLGPCRFRRGGRRRLVRVGSGRSGGI